MGVIFVAMFACWVMSANLLCTLLCLVGFVAVPILAYKMLRRSYIHASGKLTFSAVWLEGIMMFLGGSLLLAVASLVFFKFIQPNFIVSQMELVIQVYRDVPELTDFADALQKMIDNRMLPRPIDLTMSLVWMTAFSGSILSLILAGIVKARGVPAGQANGTNSQQ